MGLNALMQNRIPKSKPEVSVVIPLFNESDNVLSLYSTLKASVEESGRSWEVIFVDDGSTDTTYQILGELHAKDPLVRVVQLRRNFGQTAALVAGFDHARSETIVALDGDLQNDPKDISKLVNKL